MLPSNRSSSTHHRPRPDREPPSEPTAQPGRPASPDPREGVLRWQARPLPHPRLARAPRTIPVQSTPLPRHGVGAGCGCHRDGSRRPRTGGHRHTACRARRAVPGPLDLVPGRESRHRRPRRTPLLPYLFLRRGGRGDRRTARRHRRRHRRCVAQRQASGRLAQSRPFVAQRAVRGSAVGRDHGQQHHRAGEPEPGRLGRGHRTAARRDHRWHDRCGHRRSLGRGQGRVLGMGTARHRCRRLAGRPRSRRLRNGTLVRRGRRPRSRRAFTTERGRLHRGASCQPAGRGRSTPALRLGPRLDGAAAAPGRLPDPGLVHRPGFRRPVGQRPGPVRPADRHRLRGQAPEEPDPLLLADTGLGRPGPGGLVERAAVVRDRAAGGRGRVVRRVHRAAAGP